MVRRGARHFVFLSRSGATSKNAVMLMSQLELYAKEQDIDLMLEVVRGDVSDRGHVNKAVASARTPIRGVIQAAAAFQVPSFLSIVGQTLIMLEGMSL